MTSSLGVHGLSVTLCESLQTPYNQIHVKLEDVSSFSNVEYNTYLGVWKAYGIRPGKKITPASLGIAKHAQISSLITNEDEVLGDKFCSKRSTAKKNTSNPACGSISTATNLDAEECFDDTVKLFACPERCTKTSQRFFYNTTLIVESMKGRLSIKTCLIKRCMNTQLD